ncbi:NAD(P)/FAD-dependent oxidoreductase [Ancylobacter oerskovii]|uniref:NAD(P)/FAD-dependent oxidoreductase n=1 Tax=Ancylobacter oerskovii TaxID=459519 RepID=A0ABW4YXC0_9HYPH|nr:FAD-dependent oxidoreductase [Ancylobacter oerskovii]MBS7542185.1 FAD-dependent oxidoreductase [Ancylobacter oerskovii]
MSVVVIGAGQAGFQLAASLREAGYEEPITLVGDEPVLPYQRPPLSKAYLKGEVGVDHLELRPAAFFADHRIGLAHGRVVAVDRAARRVTLEGDGKLPYGHLVFATGARNRVLPVPGAELDGVFYLRTLAEADAVRAVLPAAGRVVVIGAGFIGLEFAAVARKLGHEVVVVEAAPRVLGRALGGVMSDFFAGEHRAMGSTLMLGAGVARLVGEGGRVVAVETAEGERVAADLVVVGIGVVPNVELAAAAGLSVDNGIAVDARLLTEDPEISAIGDVASYPSRHADNVRVRLESVQNAADQGRCVAARLTGRAHDYTAVPWFWSDQADLKLQMVGLSRPGDAEVVRGDPASRRFSVFRFREERLVAIESVNRPADHMLGRRLLTGIPSLTPAQAGDEGFDLKSLLAR